MKKIKRVFLKLYIWLKYKTKSVKEIYSLTQKKRDAIFDNIQLEINRPESQWYNSVINFDKDNYILEVKVGDNRFLISAAVEFKNYQPFVIFNIYARKIDLSYYPESKRYISELIPGLSMSVDKFGVSTFGEPQMARARRDYNMEVEIKAFDSADFGRMIMELLNKR